MERRDFISFWNEAHTIIDDAIEKRDRSVAIYISPDGGMTLNKQCGSRCSYPDCRHTTDISHAINGDTFPNGFEKVEHKDKVYFVEKEHPTMTINEYQALALRTESRITTDPIPYIRVLEGLMGLNGEAGEAIDIIKKVLFQGHEFDREHMAKELGDIAWYLAVSADAIGYDLETIFQMNVDKLKARYPDGFDSEHSQHRSSDDI